jgi:hypothetical protein
VLVLAARNRQVLRYTTLEKLTGVPRQAQYCKRKKLPVLVSLVVNQPTGLPGHLYPGNRDPLAVYGDQVRVFIFDWLKRKPPSETDFIKD